MVTSLNNLALAAVQRNETVEKLVEMNTQKDKTIATLTSSLTSEKATSTKLLNIISKAGLKAAHLSTTGGGTASSSRWDPTGYCWTCQYQVTKGHNSVTCKTIKQGHQNNNLKAIYCNFVASIQSTPGFTNPLNLNTTALIDTGTNISLLQSGALAQRADKQTSSKSVIQPKGTLLTTKTHSSLVPQQTPCQRASSTLLSWHIQ
eukprot:CCRYP_011920-RA/>CCRYP_011920-RA protein AED:0.46 eAED:0.46 QI:0/0/0/1/0/0/2/0/203